MKIPDDQIEELSKYFGKVSSCSEGGFVYFIISNLQLPDGCKPEQVDALLCPMPRDGYNSRLFFAEKVVALSSPNWNVNGVRIIERNWHAFSWKTPQNLSLSQMVVIHLKGLL